MKIRNAALLLTLSCLGLAQAFASSNVQVKAEEDPTPNFDENFESYQIETRDSGTREDIGANWTNAWYQKTGDFDETGCAPDRFYVTSDPVNADNKVLKVDTASANESFFYLTMKGLYVKDFRLSFDLYQTAVNGWTGFNFRKPIDGRYNGVTNVMMVERAWSADSFGPQIYRSVNDSFMNVEMEGPEGGEALGWNAANFAEFTSALNTWHTVTIEAIGDVFSFSVNGKLLAKATIAKNTARNYGFVSLVSCVSAAYYDNIHLENLDETPFNPGGDTSEEHQPPTMENTSYEVELGKDAVVQVDLHGEAITSLKQAKNEVLNQYFTVDGNTLTLSSDYLSRLGAGRWTFVLTTQGGSIAFSISIVGPASSSSEAPVGPSSETPSEDKGNSGCGGEIIGSSLAAFAALSGVALLAFKRKKKE